MVLSRMEKAETREGRDSQDFKVLMIGIGICIMMILTEPLFHKIWDRHFVSRPFITATVEVGLVPGRNQLMILYDADANQEVDGTWIASIHGLGQEQLATRRGDGSYNSKADDARFWTWDAFFHNKYNTRIPEVPYEPFRVCVRYVVTARDSGEKDESPQYCSPVFDPEKPAFLELPQPQEI